MLLLAQAQFLLNPPFAFLTQSVAQSMASSTFTAINFDGSTVDTYGGHSNVTNNSRYTAQVPGWYQVSAQVGYNANATGVRAPGLFVNGAAVTPIVQPELPATASGNTIVQDVGPVYLNVGDYVEVRGYQTSGGALNTYAPGCYMSLLWVHA